MNYESITVKIAFLIGFVVLAPFIGGLIDGCDRKISAKMQGRKGPSIFQPFRDLRKLFQKQFLAVHKNQLILTFTFTFFVVMTGAMFYFGTDLLLCFFALSTAAMFLVLAGAMTHSPFATTGVQREMAQMMAYEPMVLLTAVGFYLAPGSHSFRVSEIITNTELPLIIFIPGFFIGFVFILTIKFRKSPFDISTSHHAHQEVVKGLTSELCGAQYGLTTIAEWYENVFLYGVVALFFLTNNPWSILWSIGACIVVFFIEVLIDNTSARVKWQLMLKLAWGVTIVTGGLNLLILELI